MRDDEITVYVEIKGNKPEEPIELSDPRFGEAVKPPIQRVKRVEGRLRELGFSLVDTSTGNYHTWGNRVVIRGSKERLDEVFGLNVIENGDFSPDARTHYTKQFMEIKDPYLLENVTNIEFTRAEEVTPVAQARRVRRM